MKARVENLLSIRLKCGGMQNTTPFFFASGCLVRFVVVFSCAIAVADTPVNFNSDVRPILSDKCFKCHGPDENARKADLRLDHLEEASHLLSQDDPASSELLRRIHSKDSAEQMPPPESKLELSHQEMDVLTRWIKSGAPYARHWAFEPVQKISVPSVKDTGWPKNEIDFFILSRLEERGLVPSLPADKETLIRRLTFDLTGLAPTIEQIEAFVSEQSPETYAELVVTLLAKKQYGERMSADWLDVARYSDTYGYQVDRDRRVWPWRDWLIGAFNANLPYDQFMTWQLAGDLLPAATDEQILATTFNRLHSQKTEGGSVEEEFRVEYVADRNHTFGTAFLGLSLECARCHDHKYDPISQKEYYQFFAFFNNIDESGLYAYHNSLTPTPTLLLADEEQKSKLAEFDERITEAEQSLEQLGIGRQQAFEDWSRSTRESIIASEKIDELLAVGRVGHLTFDDVNNGANTSVPGKMGSAIHLSGDDQHKLNTGRFQQFDPFSVSLWINTPDVKDRAVIFHCSGGWTDAGSHGYQLLIEEGRLSAALVHFWPGNAVCVRTRDPIPTSQWLHVAILNDGSSRASGLQIVINGEPADCEVVRDSLTRVIDIDEKINLAIGARKRDRGFTNGLVDEFAVYNRRLTSVEVAHLHDGQSLQQLLETPIDKLSPLQEKELREFYLAHYDENCKEQVEALRDLRQEQSKFVSDIPEIMVMQEMANRRPSFVLQRGAYNAPGEPVQPDTPAIFPTFSQDLPRNRLGLARWLTDPGHPLTARVVVNHYWQMLFGRGLVQTPEDFGSQGKAPTHPDLLDWLAGDFVAHGWDVKRLLAQIVKSATYRQRSSVSSQAFSGDPENDLLSRFPSYRLSAEMIRDNALAVSGLLVDRIGGNSVKPYEVAVSFKPLQRDKGEGLYRRSLYTFWKRTAPAPVMMSLDASKREVCVVKREQTSSPIQAFVLLNDPQFVEASRMLGQRMLQKHGEDTDAVIESMFFVLTGRRPNKTEQDVLLALFQQQLEYFEKHVEDAEKFLKTGDAPRDDAISTSRLGAAGVVASVLLNYDECVMKR